MKLIVNTAYGVSILLTQGGAIVYEKQDFSATADDLLSCLKDKNIDYAQLTHLIFIDGPGSQISARVGLACLKSVLLVYPQIIYISFSYFELMLMNVVNLIDWKNRDLLIAIGVSSKRFYSMLVSQDSQRLKYFAGSEDGVENIIDENKDKVKLDNIFFYCRQTSYVKDDIDILLEKNKNLYITGHRDFKDYKKYLNLSFPLKLSHLRKVLNYI